MTGAGATLAAAQAVVVGGGPAGAVAALILARAGVHAVLVHDPDAAHGRPALGEVLPPAARPAFDRLGVASVLDDVAHSTVPGTLAAWGAREPVPEDHVRSPFGDGLQVDRVLLDAALRSAAVAAGVVLVRGPRRAWGSLAAPGGPHVVIDASGRPATVARAAGATIDRADRLVAAIGVLPCAETRDRRVLVVSEEDGWWSRTRRADGLPIAAFHTDADLLRANGRTALVAWWAAMKHATPVGAITRPSGAGPPRRIDVVAADSRRLREPGAPPRRSRPGMGMPGARRPLVLAAGEAEMAFDPLSSLGILAAISSAEEAALAAIAWLDGAAAGRQALARRLAAREARWERYLARLRETYAAETRWPDRPFWARRRSGPVADDGLGGGGPAPAL